MPHVVASLLVAAQLAACAESAVSIDGDQSMDGPPSDAAGRAADLGSGGAGTDLRPPADLASAVQPITLQYVTNAITLPAARTEYTADLDGDGRAENRFGELVAVLASQGIDLRAEQRAAVARGEGLALVSLATVDARLVSDDGARASIWAAALAEAPDFSGAGRFAIDPAFAGADLPGVIASYAFHSDDPIGLGNPPTVWLRIALSREVSAAMPLRGARVRFTAATDRLTGGVINGALRSDDIDAILIPAMARVLDAMAQAPSCPRGSQCATVRAIFDTNVDGRVSVGEVRGSALMQALLKPDVDLFDDAGRWRPSPANAAPESVSTGVGFTALGASFSTP